MSPSGHLCGIAEGVSLVQVSFVASLGGTTPQVGVHETGFWGSASRSRFVTSIVPGFVAPPGPGMGLTISAEITSAHAEHVTFGSNGCPQDLRTNNIGLPSRGRARRSPHAVRARIAGTRSGSITQSQFEQAFQTKKPPAVFLKEGTDAIFAWQNLPILDSSTSANRAVIRHSEFDLPWKGNSTAALARVLA
jgi:hypothetical protein